MNIIRDFCVGVFSVLKVTGAPLLYRYHYRNSAEGLRKDWDNIGNDIRTIIGKLEEYSNDNRR